MKPQTNTNDDATTKDAIERERERDKIKLIICYLWGLGSSQVEMANQLTK